MGKFAFLEVAYRGSLLTEVRAEIILEYVKNSYLNIDFATLQNELLPLAESKKSMILARWLEKSPSNNFDLEVFKEFFSQESEGKEELLEEWNGKNPSKLSINDVKELLLKTPNDKAKHALVFQLKSLANLNQNYSVNRRHQDRFSLQDFAKTIRYFEPLILPNIEENVRVQKQLSDNNNAAVTLINNLQYDFDIETLKLEVLPLIQNRELHILAAEHFIDQSDNFDLNLEENKKFVKESLQKSSNDLERANFINILFKKDHQYDFSVLQDFLPLFNEDQRKQLILGWFWNSANTNLRTYP